MDNRNNLMPSQEDSVLLLPKPRVDTPSTSSTAQPSPKAVDEIRDFNKRIVAIEAMLASINSAIQTKTNTTQTAPAPPEQPPSRVPRGSDPPPSTSSSRETSHAHPPAASKSAVRDALELIPTFDGHNISVFQFSRACKRAKELILPSEEGTLVRFLRGKLVGHAYLVVEDETHYTIEQTVDSLKRAFAPGRTSLFYRSELNILRKSPHEYIFDYIGRAKDLRSSIIECEQSEFGRDLTKNEILKIDAAVVNSFYVGLPAQYRAEIRLDECVTPTEAYNKAITIERRLEQELTYLRDMRAKQAPRGQQQDSRPHPPAPRDPPPVTILRRDPNTPPAYNNRAPRSQDNPFPNTRKICNYCQNFGHLMFECRKRQIDSENAYHQNQGNAPAASANESRGRPNRQIALPLQENSLPSTSLNLLPEESQQLN